MHSTDSRRRLDRRQFLRLSAVGLASAALLGGSTGRILAQTDSSLEEEFQAAAEEYGVPVELLIAMGYVNTRLEMPPPEASAYEKGDLHGWGGYGIMALVQNPSSDTLGQASELTGIPEDKLKTDRAANLRGGAALLAEARKEVATTRFSAQGAASTLPGVAGGGLYNTPAGIGGGSLYAEQVLAVLRNGVSVTTKAGEKVALAARKGI